MASLTIRNIDDGLKQKLRVRAAEHGVSMEEEARRMLMSSLAPAPGQDCAESIPGFFERLRAEHGGGGDLSLPDRAEWTDRSLDLP